MDRIELLQKLFNDSINMEAVNETLRDSSVRSYRNLYDIQKSLTGMRRLDIPLQDFDKVKRLPREQQSTHYPMRYMYTTGIDIVSGENEYKFKTSGLQNTPMSIFDISDNITLLKNNFIVYLDGKFISTMSFLITESECSIIFNIDPGTKPNDYVMGVNREWFETLYEANEVVHIYVVPNFSIDCADVNKHILNLTNGTVKKDMFKNGGSGIQPGNTMFFMNTDSDNSKMDLITADVLDNGVELNPASYGNDVVLYRVLAVSFNMLHNVMKLDATPDSSRWLMLNEEYELPLPMSNIIPLVSTVYGYTLDPDVEIKMYYPNIYEFTNVGNRDLYLFIFYSDTTYDSKYKNDLKLLGMVYDNILDKYKNNELPDLITCYEPITVELFDTDDFVSSVYFPDSRNLYNINRLQEYIFEDPSLWIKYIYLKLNNIDKYFINTSKIDLSSRIRITTRFESDDLGDNIDFPEERYVFSIRKPFIGEYDTSFRVFIDGVCVRPTMYTQTFNKDFYLFYIPTWMISKDTVVEIERYKRVKYNSEVLVESVAGMNSEDWYNTLIADLGVNSPDFACKTKPILVNTYDDTGMIDAYNFSIINENREFIPTENYSIAIYNDVVGQYILVNPNGHYALDREFYLIFNEEYIGRTLYPLVDTASLYDDYQFDEPVVIHYDSFIMTPKVRDNNVRIFKNGLCLPSSRYFVSDTGTSGADTTVAVSSECDIGDTIAYDIVPIQFEPEYYQKEISTNGYVYTANGLSSPLDLRLYDVYLNGRKLNSNNIEILSSNRFIIKNVDSTKNLYIVKRRGIQDAFDMNLDNDINNKLLIENNDEILNIILKKLTDIDDTEEDIIGDIISDVFGHIKFVKEYLEFIFINPNELQVTRAMSVEFPEYMVDGVFLLETNTNPDAQTITSIDSNLRRLYMANGSYRYSFTPLHIGNHNDARKGEYMCDPVSGAPGMKTEEGEILSYGFISRLAQHKTTMMDKLSYHSMAGVSVYQLELNDNTRCTVVNPDTNVFDDECDFGLPVKRLMISIDMDILEKGTDDVMMLSEFDPTIKLEYALDSSDPTNITSVQLPLTQINNMVFDINSNSMVFKGIYMVDDGSLPNTLKCILHSILVAF